MDSYNLGLIMGIMACLILSAFFSSSETAFSSLNKIRLKNLAKNGDRRAGEALQLSEDFDTILSTILIGNNIVNILSSTLATVVFVSFFGDLGVTLSTVIMTILVLIVGEITPKMLAKQNAENTAIAVMPILKFFVIILKPINVPFTWWKRFIARVTKNPEIQTYSDEELITIVEEVETQGGLDAHESELIRSAIEFSDLDAVEIITPRIDMAAIPVTATVQMIKDAFTECAFSRLPVYREEIDDIMGVIHERDFYQLVCDRGVALENIITPVLFVQPNTKLPVLLRQLQKQQCHMSMVVDEFGAIMGIVTIEDILEELVGEIWDEHDEVVVEIKRLQDGCYLVLGSMDLEGFCDYFGLPVPNLRYQVQTVSGWVVQTLGRIPDEGDRIAYENTLAEVSSVDNRRIKELKIKILSAGNSKS